MVLDMHQSDLAFSELNINNEVSKKEICQWGMNDIFREMRKTDYALGKINSHCFITT